MPRRRVSWEDQVADQVLATFDADADALAERLGDAPRTQRLSDADELDLFAFTDERYEDAAALVAAGYTPEEATNLKHPFRFDLIRAGRPDPYDQVKKARELKKRMREAVEAGWQPPRGVPEGTASAHLLDRTDQGPDAEPVTNPLAAVAGAGMLEAGSPGMPVMPPSPDGSAMGGM